MTPMLEKDKNIKYNFKKVKQICNKNRTGYLCVFIAIKERESLSLPFFNFKSNI